MKHVKRILVSLAAGLFMGVVLGVVDKLSGTENWMQIAFYAGWFEALGCWLGIGMKFYHEDDDDRW